MKEVNFATFAFYTLMPVLATNAIWILCTFTPSQAVAILLFFFSIAVVFSYIIVFISKLIDELK